MLFEERIFNTFDLVKSGIGLSLVREHIAIREAQAYGLVSVDGVGLECVLSFVCLKKISTIRR